jgi:glycosyltransferase involved in cell wall biosynthesis
MSMGATIVASDTAPVREVVDHGETGLLVDFFDPSALARQVTQVLADPDGHSELGRAARRHVVEHYDFHTRALPTHVDRINELVTSNARLAPG